MVATNFFRRYIYNPVIFPGEDNGIIYLAKNYVFSPISDKKSQSNQAYLVPKKLQMCQLKISIKTVRKYIKGEDNGIIYIAASRRQISSNLCAMQGKYSREEGFLRGAYIAEKWGLEIFWGKCLKITKFSDVYFLCNYLPRGRYLHACE